MIKKFNLFFLTFFMIGKIKFAPGTLASLITCFLFLALINIINITYLFLITLIIFFYSFFAINNSFNEFKSEDPQEIVVDEVVGQILPLLALPIYETLYQLPTIYYFISSFISFPIVNFYVLFIFI